MKLKLKHAALLSMFGFSVAAVNAADLETKYTANCKPLAPEQPDPNRPKRPIKLPSESTYKALSKIQDPIGKNQYDEAIGILAPLLERNLSDYDRASIQHNLAFLYAQKQQWNKAIEAEGAAVASGEMQEQQELQARQNMVFFYSATENLAKTLEALKSYFDNAWAVKPDMYLMLGSVYAQMNKFQDAICPTYIAITKHPQPKESWYSILLASHYELKDFDGAIVVAREMLDKYPNNKNNWNQLSNLLLRQEKDQEALTLMELAYLRGFLEKEADLKNLSSLYSLNNIPYKSAAVLEKAIEEGKVAASEKTWRQVAQAWTNARELDKAVRAYGEAGKFVNDGTFLAYQGELYAEMEKWKEASAVFTKAIEKGGLKDVSRVYLNIGIAQFYAGEYNKAIANLEKAAGYEKTAKNANAWIQYVNDRIKAKG